MSDVIIRSATRNDAADLTILDNLAGHNIPLMFWRELCDTDRTEDALAFGRDRLLDDDEFYNWKKGRVAVEDDMIVGMSMSYIMPAANEESETMKHSSAFFKPVVELYDQCANQWFIDALAVYPSGQHKGVGRMLFDDSIANGKATVAKTMSLIVEDTNEVAYALYRSYGFEVAAQNDFVSFEGAPEINEWLLMSRSLA